MNEQLNTQLETLKTIAEQNGKMKAFLEFGTLIDQMLSEQNTPEGSAVLFKISGWIQERI